MRVFPWVPVFALLGCVSGAPQPSPSQDAPVATESVRVLAPVAASKSADIPDREFDATHARDPFALAAKEPTRPPPRDERPRKARRFDVSELKLVGLVTQTDAPRAMLVDPNGKGWVVTKGELVGRAEQNGDAQTSWRVDRIRDGNLILVREDPANAKAAPETRVLAMRTEPQTDDRLEDD
jgi:type IV pilus assembly protein PilP